MRLEFLRHNGRKCEEPSAQGSPHDRPMWPLVLESCWSAIRSFDAIRPEVWNLQGTVERMVMVDRRDAILGTVAAPSPSGTIAMPAMLR